MYKRVFSRPFLFQQQTNQKENTKNLETKATPIVMQSNNRSEDPEPYQEDLEIEGFSHLMAEEYPPLDNESESSVKSFWYNSIIC